MVLKLLVPICKTKKKNKQTQQQNKTQTKEPKKTLIHTSDHIKKVTPNRL